MHLRGMTIRRPGLGLVHAFAGFTGIRLLTWALEGPRHGDAMGVGSFGTAAAVLFIIALLFGFVAPRLSRWGPKLTGVALAAHATIAITGFVLLLAWSSLG